MVWNYHFILSTFLRLIPTLFLWPLNYFVLYNTCFFSKRFKYIFHTSKYLAFLSKDFFSTSLSSNILLANQLYLVICSFPKNILSYIEYFFRHMCSRFEYRFFSFLFFSRLSVLWSALITCSSQKAIKFIFRTCYVFIPVRWPVASSHSLSCTIFHQLFFIVYSPKKP